jgi:hypothetical protein
MRIESCLGPDVERSRKMRTLKTKLGVAVLAVAGGGFLLAAVPAKAQNVMASDEAAGFLVFPKIIVQASGGSGGLGIDTLIQITNVSEADSPVTVHCWYINANSRCDATGAVCQTNADCGGTQCVQGWVPNNFEFELTNEHPIGWSVLQGRNLPPTQPDSLATGNVPAVLEVPFRGELKCVQVDGPDGAPSARNDLKGEATIITVQAPPAGGTPPRMHASAYNAVGFQADPEADQSGDVDDPLCLGGLPGGAPAGTECAMTYAPCPNVLIFDHFFEGAEAPAGGVVQTDLTLVPCSQALNQTFPDFRFSAPPQVVAQMLVYNEFEQRFSTSTRVQCYNNTRLADIDTRPGSADDVFSVFAAGVQGTQTGQTRIRGVTGPVAATGYGLIGVAQEFYSTAIGSPADASDAFNLHADIGFRGEFDAVYGVNGFVTPGP